MDCTGEIVAIMIKEHTKHVYELTNNNASLNQKQKYMTWESKQNLLV